MREIYLNAPAKINLGLDVLARRPDGYHDLRMIMQTVALYDKVNITRTVTPGIRLQTNVSFLPADGRNLACRAAQLLADEFGIRDGVYIDLEKHIPVAAGLAGGSTDAAAVLTGMNRLFELGLSEEELMQRAVKLGADVPYCIMQGTALAEGIGEQLTRLVSPPPCSILLVKPGVHVSTAFVYGHLHADELDCHPDIGGQIAALEAGDLEKLCALMGNVLETVTIPAHPVIARIKEAMLEAGALGSLMSGSGPTVFGLFRREEDAAAAMEKIHAAAIGQFLYLTRPYEGHADSRDSHQG